ncbi:MAG TPA: hypothetical protein VG755_33920 [Nannocystaceae bacterium]|nr:hypothetical protein [Nannocystaceae bacterium]
MQRHALRLLVIALGLACDSAKQREERIAAAPQTPKPSEPTPPPKPAGPPTDPSLLDAMLVGEPTWRWSASERRFACASTTKKGEDVTYAFARHDETGTSTQDATQLVQGAREFATKRRPVDAAIAQGYEPLVRVPWPKQGRTLAVGDRELQWTDAGEIAVVQGKQTLATTKLPRKDMVPVAVHTGADKAVLVEAKFDPKDKTQQMNVGYTDCVVVPLG